MYLKMLRGYYVNVLCEYLTFSLEQDSIIQIQGSVWKT